MPKQSQNKVGVSAETCNPTWWFVHVPNHEGHLIALPIHFETEKEAKTIARYLNDALEYHIELSFKEGRESQR